MSTLLTHNDRGILHITLNRPESRNAMSLAMVQELLAVFESAAQDVSIRALVLRGAGGHFCAGGDIKDMASARGVKITPDNDPIAALNRAFGKLLQVANTQPQAVVCVLEGAVLGGGFGLACVSDVSIAAHDCKFGLPETSLGIIPAQIAPFVVNRIGITQARRLGVCGGRFDGTEAARMGLVHFVETGAEALEARLTQVLADIRKCAPHASRVTKKLMLDVAPSLLTDGFLDNAAKLFSAAVLSDEGMEGTMAFIQKRPASWTTL